MHKRRRSLDTQQLVLGEKGLNIVLRSYPGGGELLKTSEGDDAELTTLSRELREEKESVGNPLRSLRLQIEREGWIYRDNHFWRWNGHSHFSRLTWKEASYALLESYRRAREVGKKEPTEREFIDKLKFISLELGAQTNPIAPHHPDLVNFANGVLNLDTLEMLPSSKEYEFNYAIGSDFGGLPKDDEPRPDAWLRIIEHHVPCKEDRDLLEAWLGYALTDDRTKPQMLVLHGPGDTGKSTILAFLERIMGKELVAQESLRGVLHDPALAANLVGKRVTIATEAQICLKELEAMKALLSFERMAIHVYFVGKMTVTPACKFVCSANDEGWMPDKLEIRKRIRVVKFANPVPSDKQDPELGKKLWQERSQIIGRLIRAYLLYRSRSQFDLNGSTVDYLRGAHENINPIVSWASMRELKAGDTWYPVRFLLALYTEETGNRQMKLETFSRLLKEASFPIVGERRRHEGPDGRQLRSRGVRLANDLNMLLNAWAQDPFKMVTLTRAHYAKQESKDRRAIQDDKSPREEK
jgi:hypothetical protein